MSMRKVAQLAGVSTTTVSRVVNDHPNVAMDTVETVRRAMQQLRFAPTAARQAGRGRGGNDGQAAATSVAFLVFGTTGDQPAPAFEQLLNGVSAAAAQHDLSLIFSFVSDPSELPPRITERRVDGVLLHGAKPTAVVQARLKSLPTVWLMANPQRPEWGDQILPDNTAIGELAASYLVRRGHRRLAYLGCGGGSWSMEIRSLAFARAAVDLGAHADVIETCDETTAAAQDLWNSAGLAAAGRELIEKVIALKDRPTGLFVSEDRLLPSVDAALTASGLSVGPGRDVELISCNNERPHHAHLQSRPATIDIRVDSIGRRGVEQLVWRLRNPQVSERIRAMVEPVLVEAEEEPSRPAAA